MTDFDEICDEAIGSARPLGAAADFIEACRLYLTQRRFPDDEFSIFYSRLGEAFCTEAGASMPPNAPALPSSSGPFRKK